MNQTMVRLVGSETSYSLDFFYNVLSLLSALRQKDELRVSELGMMCQDYPAWYRKIKLIHPGYTEPVG